MAPVQQAVFTLFLMICLGAFLYVSYLKPKIALYNGKKTQTAKLRGDVDRVGLSVTEISQASPGEAQSDIPTDTLKQFSDVGNTLYTEAEVAAFKEDLKVIVEGAGGKSLDVREGETISDYIKDNQRDDVYRVLKQPVSVHFTAGYDGVSNVLFQLTSLKHMITVTNLALHSAKGGDVAASFNLDVFYVASAGSAAVQPGQTQTATGTVKPAALP